MTIYHNGEKLIVAGDKEVVKFVTEKEENLTLREIKEKIEELSQSEEDHRYQRRRETGVASIKLFSVYLTINVLRIINILYSP